MSGQAKQVYLLEEDSEHILGVCSAYHVLQQPEAAAETPKKPLSLFGGQHKLHGINRRNLIAVG